MSHDLDTRKRFLDLRSRGRSYDRIAKELHVSKRTLITWSIEMQYELEALRTLHLDALREEIGAQKQQRMELLARQIRRLRDEFEARDLARIHETNLCNLLLRYMVALRQEDETLDMPMPCLPDDPECDQIEFPESDLVPQPPIALLSTPKQLPAPEVPSTPLSASLASPAGDCPLPPLDTKTAPKFHQTRPDSLPQPQTNTVIYTTDPPPEPPTCESPSLNPIGIIAPDCFSPQDSRAGFAMTEKRRHGLEDDAMPPGLQADG